MHRRYDDYVNQTLSAAGFVILDSRRAFLARPDLWNSQHSAAADFNLAEIEYALKSRDRSVILAMADGIPLATRSLRDLAIRIEYITGRPVAEVVTVATFLRPAAPKLPTVAEREGDFELERLRRLAKEALPDHDCPHRRQILAARESVGVA